MERLALIGVSHRRGGASALEAWQSAFGDDAQGSLNSLGLSEFVPIVTCNRWDVVLALPEGLSAEEARTRLTPAGVERRPYAYLGDAALEQLIRIAASLDSLNPGEDQIMRQVREAYAQAQRQGTTGATTAYAFDAALRIAKRVRREVALAPMNTSLFSLARPELERTLAPGDLVAVLGAGEMGTLAAKTIAALDGVRLLVVNRSEERARQLARHLGGEHATLDRFIEAPPDVTAVVTATPVGKLLGRETLARMPGLRLAIDMGIPRNVDREAAAARSIRVLDVDTLQLAGARRREELGGRLAEAEKLVRDELERAIDEWAERQLGPAIKRLRELYLQTIGERLPDDEARRLAHKFAHVPVKGLRAVAREHGLEAAKTFLWEAGLLDEEEGRGAVE
ncbi:MAG TPA: glutamyl-tRNA reductase [Trueperaceae bacterium]